MQKLQNTGIVGFSSSNEDSLTYKMEVKSECTREIAKYWDLFSRMLSEVSGKEGCKFNPKAFLLDEVGANLIHQTECTCQWHFKNSAQQKVNSLYEDFEEEILMHCYDFHTAATATHYNL